MPIYERYADYEVLASESFNALKGYPQGWCSPAFVNQTPLIYDLYLNRNEHKPQRQPGQLFGQFQLHRKYNGICEIWFIEKASSFELERDLNEEERNLLGEFPLKAENLDLYDEIKSRIRAEAEVEEESLKDHFRKVIEVYFDRLAEWGIKIEKRFDAISYEEADNKSGKVGSTKGENSNREAKEPWEFSPPKKEQRDKIIWTMRESGRTWEEIRSELWNQNIFTALSTIRNNYERMKELAEKIGR